MMVTLQSLNDGYVAITKGKF